MTLFWRIILSLNVFIIYIFTTNSFAAKPSPPSFASAEHIIAGDNVRIFLKAHDKGQRRYIFHLPSGLDITYGELLAFADFYGTPEQPISMGKTDAERKSRFLAAFNDFALNSSRVEESKQLIEIIRDEQNSVNDGMRKGQSSEKIYNEISNEIGRRLNCATGGGCSATGWWLTPGRYLKLANDDYDHFGDRAWISYQTGHELAIQEALVARKTHDLKRLELAYALNGFACHYLSDRFASGHLRTPRKELADNVTPKVVGSLLSHYMHNEENILGLHVHNLNGNRWVVYGDFSYLSLPNTYNRRILQIALQASVNQIFNAYHYGVENQYDEVYNLLPIIDEEGNSAQADISSMFYWDKHSQKIMRRQDLSNPYDRHWTANWWGWSTLSLLIKQHGELPALAQAQLALSEVANNALEAGFITDKIIINYIIAKT